MIAYVMIQQIQEPWIPTIIVHVWIRLVKPLKKKNKKQLHDLLSLKCHCNWAAADVVFSFGSCWSKLFQEAHICNGQEWTFNDKKNPWSWAFRIECAIQYHFIHSVNDYINFDSKETKIIYCANNFQIIHAVEVERKPHRLMYKLYHFERPTMNIDICTAGAPMLLSICLFCFLFWIVIFSEHSTAATFDSYVFEWHYWNRMCFSHIFC